MAGSDPAPEDADGVIDWTAVVGEPPAVDPPDTDEVEEAEETEEVEEVDASEPVEPREEDESLIPSKKIAAIALGLVVAYFLANFVDVWLASNSEYEGDATAAVVLGAAQYNGEPSDALRGRLDQAAELYRTERVSIVVVTGGGQADDITTEAKTGYDYLRDTASIPDEDLRLEVDGASTYQSLAATARFLATEEIDDVILVTDPYHAKRSRLIAQEVGFEANVSPTDSSTSLSRLVKESGAVAVGRIIGFRRVDAYVDL